MQEGFRVLYICGLPIQKDDYADPWDPFGGNVAAALGNPICKGKQGPKRFI
jgi:hypothetical protein